MFDNQEILLKYVNKSNFYPVYLVRNKKNWHIPTFDRKKM